MHAPQLVNQSTYLLDVLLMFDPLVVVVPVKVVVMVVPRP